MTVSTVKKPNNKAAVKLSLLKSLEPHNMVVHLKKSIEVTKIFGIKKQTDTVIFFVDKPKEFINALPDHLSKT